MKQVIEKWFQKAVDSIDAFYKDIGVNSRAEFDEYVGYKVPEALCYWLGKETGIVRVSEQDNVYQIHTVSGFFKVRLYLMHSDSPKAMVEFIV